MPRFQRFTVGFFLALLLVQMTGLIEMGWNYGTTAYAQSATLSGPASVAAGANFTVDWSGPNNQGDYIGVYAAGETSNYKYLKIAYTSAGSPAKLRAPDEAGNYEVRYISAQSRLTWASAPLSVTPVSASVSPPASIAAGASFTVDWSGPNNQGDYIAVYAAGETSNYKYLKIAYASAGTPAKLRAPDEAGNYEVRYISAQSRLTWASAPLSVTPVSASVSPPASIAAGANFTVDWTGPNNTSDYIAIYAAGETSNYKYLKIAYTSAGSPAKLRAPDEAGNYEVRYISAQSRLTWAKAPLAVCAAGTNDCAPSAPTPTATPGATQTPVATNLTVSFLGFLEDRVGRGERMTPDGIRDGTFQLTLDRAGSHAVTFLEVRADPSLGFHVWETRGANGLWVLGVSSNTSGAPLANGTDTSVSIPFADQVGLRLYGADDGSLQRGGGPFSVQVCFNGSQTDCSTTTLQVPPATPSPTATPQPGSTPVPTQTPTVTAPYPAPVKPPTTRGNTSGHPVTSGGGLRYYHYRGQSPIEVDIPVGRYVGETDSAGKLTDAELQRLVDNRILSPNASVQLAVWASWKSPPPNPSLQASLRYDPREPGDGGSDPFPIPTPTPEPQQEVARGSLNGCSFGVYSAPDSTWTVWRANVPVSCVRFPTQKGSTTAPPAPSLNKLQIDVDSSKIPAGQTWAVQVDWASIGVEGVWPVAFLHGKGDGGYSWVKRDPSASDPNLNMWNGLKHSFDEVGFLGEASTVNNAARDPKYRGVVELSNHPQGSIIDNGRRLAGMLQQVKNVYGVERLNILAHSKGGLDARAYITHVSPRGAVPDIATLITLSSPHQGSAIAELPYIITGVITAVVGPVGLASILLFWNDLNDSQRDLMRPNMALFNLNTPNRAGVRYFTVGADGGNQWSNIPNPNWSTLPTDKRGDTVHAFGTDHRVPYTKGMFAGAVGWTILKLFHPFNGNDDLVTTESARLNGATDLGTISKNHFTVYTATSSEPANRVIPVLQLGGLGSRAVQDLADAEVPAPASTEGLIESSTGTLPAGGTTSVTFQLDQEGAALFGAGAVNAGLELSLINPAGQRFTPQTLAPEMVYLPPDAAGGSGGSFVVPSAAAGTWTLELRNPSATDLQYTTVSLAPSSLTFELVTTPEVPRAHGPVHVTATLRENSAGVTGAALTATITHPDNTTSTITLNDNGTDTDTAAGDGKYAGSFVPAGAGVYGVSVNAAGVRSGGAAFNRTAGSAVTVAAAGNRLTGTFSETGRDADGNGLLEALDTSVGLDVAGGSYQVTASLISSDSKVVATAVTSATLAAGPGTLTLAFPGHDIATAGRNGPYTIGNVVLTDLSTDQPADLRSTALTTTAYQAQQFEHDEPLRLTGQVGSRGLDTGGDSRFEGLEVTMEVDVKSAGTYQWNARLLANDGHEYAFASNSLSLNAGRQVLPLLFPSGPIYSYGRDGQLVVRDLALWREEGDASLLVETVGSTATYQAAAFMPGGQVFAPVVTRAQAEAGW